MPPSRGPMAPGNAAPVRQWGVLAGEASLPKASCAQRTVLSLQALWPSPNEVWWTGARAGHGGQPDVTPAQSLLCELTVPGAWPERSPREEERLALGSVF